MMDQWLNRIDRFNTKNLILWVVAASILLAAWMQYIQHGWINPDSVLYLEQARLFSLGDWRGATQVFNWPLYGACIGFVHKLTSLSIHVSAQLLNMLFFGMATASFLCLIKLAGGNNRTLVAGTLLLFGSQYIVGDVLEMLMRDEGFWAFYLTALVFFIRYNQQLKKRDAVLWQICTMFAILFRIEAILFLLFLPLIVLFEQSKPIAWRLKKTLNAYSLTILATIIIGATLATQPQLSMSQFGRLQEVFTLNLYHEFTQQLFTKANIMSSQVLGTYLEEFAIPGLLLTFLYVMGSKIITATGFIGTGLAVLNLKQSYIKQPHLKQLLPTMQPTVRRILIMICLIAFISMALIITKVFVLSSRYVVALAWVLLIFASFYFSALSSNSLKKPRAVFLIICLILGLGFIKNTLPKRDGYNFAQDAVAWVQSANTDNKQVYYDDSRLRYYAKAPFQGKGDFWKSLEANINNKNTLPYDYLILTIGKRDQAKKDMLEQQLSNYKEVKRFYHTKHKKYCAIYLKQFEL